MKRLLIVQPCMSTVPLYVEFVITKFLTLPCFTNGNGGLVEQEWTDSTGVPKESTLDHRETENGTPQCRRSLVTVLRRLPNLLRKRVTLPTQG